MKLKKILPELGRLFEKQKNASKEGPWAGGQALFDCIVDGSMEQGFEGVLGALEEGVHFDRIVDAISLAASERLLRFDARIDRDPHREEGWLDVTHLLTYANALREAYVMEPCAELLRGLFYASKFVHYVRHLDAPLELRFKYEPLAGSGFGAGHLLDGLRISLEEKCPPAALAYARAYVEEGHDFKALSDMLLRFAIEDSAVVDIMIAHTIKTTVAALHESSAIFGDQRRFLPLYAALRFLAAPKRERWVMRNALMAIKLGE